MAEEKEWMRKSINWVFIFFAFCAGLLIGGIIVTVGSTCDKYQGLPFFELEKGTRYKSQDFPPHLLLLQKVTGSVTHPPRLYQIDGTRKDTLPKEFIVTQILKNGEFVIIPYKPVKSAAKVKKK